MNGEERIKEIAKDIPFLELEREVIVSSDMKTRCSWMLSEEDTVAIAEVLCNKGYRKESETAKEILARIKNMYKENGFCINHTTKLFIEQLAKEYGAGLEE